MEWVSSDDVIVSAEEDVFKGIVKRVSYNKSERESCFPELLRQIRLMSISHDFLLKELIKEELITTNIECLNFVVGSLNCFFELHWQELYQITMKVPGYTDRWDFCLWWKKSLMLPSP